MNKFKNVRFLERLNFNALIIFYVFQMPNLLKFQIFSNLSATNFELKFLQTVLILQIYISFIKSALQFKIVRTNFWKNSKNLK